MAMAALLALLPVSLSEGAAGSTTCEDTDSSCNTWAKSGECSRNPAYMSQNCPFSCGSCTAVAASSMATTATGVPTEALMSSLKTVRAWAPERLANLRAALDPDGDGLVDVEDWKVLTGEICQTALQSKLKTTDADHSTCSGGSDGHGDVASALPGEASHPTSSEDGAVSLIVAERTPTFILGRTPPKQAPSLYYIRAGNVIPLDATSQNVFERCAAQCLLSDECWMFSINPAHRSCSIHTKLWGFTSLTV